MTQQPPAGAIGSAPGAIAASAGGPALDRSAADSLGLPAGSTLELRRCGEHVLLVVLNRPQAGNALDTRMATELLELWNRLTEDARGFRAVVLTGAGERVFCAGGDLKERNGMSVAQWQRQHELFERMVRALIDLPLPVIAAVNGAAFAGGLELALCCDFIHASRTARFALTEVTLGIMPGAGGTQTLPRAIGERRAKELIMTGRPFSSAEAAQWGLLNAVHEPERLLPVALETAAVIAANAPLAIRQVKKSVRYGGQMELRTALHFEVEAYNHLIGTEDRTEGVRAFNEKRPPRFSGR